jgi:hypothetical protein
MVTRLCLTGLCLLAAAAAQVSITVTHAEPLRFAFAAELLASQLEAVRLGGELGDDGEANRGAAASLPGGGEVDNEMPFRQLHLFAGSLAGRAPRLFDELRSALSAVQQAESGAGEDLGQAVYRAQGLLTQARGVLVPPHLSEDPTFRAAVLSRLALSASGFARGYEEAAEGEAGAYIFGWSALQRAKGLWAELEPEVADPNIVSEVERVFSLLDELMPTAEPPERFRDPEDVEVAAQDLVFALEAAIGAQLQPRDLATVLSLVERQADEGCSAFERGRPRLALELVLSARIHYVESVAATVSMLAPGPGGEIRRFLGESLPEQIAVGEAGEVVVMCSSLQESITRAAAVLR